MCRNDDKVVTDFDLFDILDFDLLILPTLLTHESDTLNYLAAILSAFCILHSAFFSLHAAHSIIK